MKNVLTAEQIRIAEAEAVKRGVDELFLRFNAALAVADEVIERAANGKTRTAVFCGSGGNGYDGLLIACRLAKLGCDVTAYTVGDINKFSAAAIAYAKNERLNIRPSDEYICDANFIVDAIFGIGLNREITGAAKELIDKLNGQNKAFRLSVDIPSGLDADSGKILGTCFHADATVTFSCYKNGMLFESGRSVCGKILVKDVGIDTLSSVRVYEDADFQPYVRDRAAHKGNAGRVFIVGGCGSMIGAPMLAGAAAHAAYLNGAGTVTVCLPDVHRTALSARATMAMMKFLPTDADGFVKFDKKSLDEIASKATSVGLGMGMGACPDLRKIIGYFCENYEGNLVLDADALNAIGNDNAFLKNAKPNVIITPHVGEFMRLTGKPATVDNAMELAQKTGAVVVMKSATTVITDGREARVNVSGTPAMAKGGMGDVLCGCITALSCSFSPIEAASIACYRNGVGAERAVSSYAEMMLTASDVLKYADYEE